MYNRDLDEVDIFNIYELHLIDRKSEVLLVCSYTTGIVGQSNTGMSLEQT